MHRCEPYDDGTISPFRGLGWGHNALSPFSATPLAPAALMKSEIALVFCRFIQVI